MRITAEINSDRQHLSIHSIPWLETELPTLHLLKEFLRIYEVHNEKEWSKINEVPLEGIWHFLTELSQYLAANRHSFRECNSPGM